MWRLSSSATCWLAAGGAHRAAGWRAERLAPWKLNRTLSDVLLLEVISGAEWAMTLVACFSLTTR